MDKYLCPVGVVQMGRRKIINNRSGVGLIYAVLVLLVVSILSVAVFTLFSSNMNQAQMQEDAMRSHFIAVSGVVVTLGALLQDNQSLLNSYFDKSILTTVNPLSDTIEFDGGEAQIVISSFIEDDMRIVNIQSIGQATNSSVSREVNMWFRIEYPEIQNWD